MRSSAALILTALGLACASGEEGSGDRVWDPMAATMEVRVTPSSVQILYHVTNAGEEPVRFAFPTAQRYDLVVRMAGGEEVWRWSDGKAFTEVLTEDSLEPGETWEMTATWNHGSRSGSYVATGILKAGDRPLRKSAAFEIP